MEYNYQKDILKTSVWLLVIHIGELLLKNISPKILRTFSGTIEIAIFSIANTYDNYMLNQYNSRESVDNLMIKVGRFQVLIVGLLTISLFLVGKDFIYL